MSSLTGQLNLVAEAGYLNLLAGNRTVVEVDVQNETRSSCITILAMALLSKVTRDAHSNNSTHLVFQYVWMCSAADDGSLFGEIFHLDCRSPDRLVRKELHNSSCATDGALSVFTQLIIVTLHCLLFGDIDFQPCFYNAPWRPIMPLRLRETLHCSSSSHCPWGKDR